MLNNTTKKIKILVIVGPTGTGKSEAAVNVGLSLGQAEIVSADSMLVYKEMDIGTAKPSKALRCKLPHHLIDVIDPSQNFSVALYQKTAREVIKEIWQRKSLPILVGGTGLYIRAVLDSLSFPDGDLTSPIRTNYAQLAASKPHQLWELLAAKDPLAAAAIEPANTRRIIRALEVIEITGRPFSSWQQNWRTYKSIYNCFIVGLTMSRQNLYLKLDARVEKMLELGLIEEVKKLKNQELSTTARQALGYKEILAYLDGEISLKKAVELIKIRTRRYAKRQFTWFKKDPRINWLSVDGLSKNQIEEEILKLVKAKEFIVI